MPTVRLFLKSAALIALGTVTFAGVASAREAPPADAADSEFNATAAWGEFEHVIRLIYAYLDRPDFDVESHLADTAELATQASTKDEFRKILHQATYAWTDPHFIVGPFADDDYNIFPSSSDLIISMAEDRYVVTDVRNGSAAEKAGIRPGWHLESVNGVSIDEAVKLPSGKLMKQPTVKQREYAATLVANGLRKGDRKLVFADNGGTLIILPSPRDYAMEVSTLPPVQTSRSGNFGIIRFNNSLGNNDTIFAFDQAMIEMADTDGLIIDLRNTPGGGNTEVGRSIIGHFVSETKSYQIHEIPSLEREFTVPRRFIEQVKTRTPYYDPARIVVLGGHWTGSMGEGIVIGMDAAADAYVISSDMGDLLGGLRNITLPSSGARVDLGSEALFHVDGTPREDFVADRPLRSSDMDEEGNDPALAAAIAFLSKD
ncbi:S41 family peptidase [Pontixanthobacter aestiaquae]|uniref:Carboxyl-terminal processing protease n=1 Tax=Pontixanthobacter aestiaquae TaxID=1509367 RepID=A0A844Z810_9SPHN|nr:S41 family peptidase [Pontixanthobacter aestiaquae]MDN3644954.1 S41 family peptidase [Pontixanthobacter aestiaquae]MXO84045.1 hypothetical protein [Pontixanthobacter aestiaquae]